MKRGNSKWNKEEQKTLSFGQIIPGNGILPAITPEVAEITIKQQMSFKKTPGCLDNW